MIPLSQLRRQQIGSFLITSSLAAGCTQTTTNSTAIPVSNQTSEKPQVIRLGYQKGGVIPIARQRGELERQLLTRNIKVEWSGPFDRCATLLQALNGNRADIGGCGDIPSISGIAAGQPLCIGSLQRPQPDSLSSAILVRGNSSIRKPDDLVGKKVAVNQGGAGEYLLLKVLEKAKIPKEKVQRVYLSPNDAAPALYQGAVDAWAVWEPYISIAQLEYHARRITTTHPAPTYGVMVVRTDAAKENPVAVKAALTALSQDGEWLNQNTDAAATYMVKELKVSEAVAKQATKNRGRESYVFPSSEDISNLQKTADWLLEQKILSQRVDIAAAVCPLGTSN
ncbi:aliphatic sulfonate ABC transporter substrate-binding protein [Nostocaceae cyanobacterium CENA369]|uniref:Putative aliphatic sulfonates-binding protein n=1 Tax=Dendronalium phyllosphericum CENA369 TaxID=1725256 RepID=A0A8J7LFS0_9NOST|nr:aliphatic sulfonate ABC transporter substrate-binding protein [Dendronalium phyllosphericum]MBH8575501.1 aliphatic sulfonate ABC transporter substrate-binding protein [Dendronalium phyllosphericum CENA369]